MEHKRLTEEQIAEMESSGINVSLLRMTDEEYAEFVKKKQAERAERAAKQEVELKEQEQNVEGEVKKD